MHSNAFTRQCTEKRKVGRNSILFSLFLQAWDDNAHLQNSEEEEFNAKEDKRRKDTKGEKEKKSFFSLRLCVLSFFFALELSFPLSPSF